MNNEKDTLPPPTLSLKSGLQVEFHGFDEDTSRKVGSTVVTVAHELSRYMPLANLIGLTVSNNYDQTLTEIDRGFTDNMPIQATHDIELEHHGVAMAIPVKRDAILKTHIVFGPHVVNLIMSNNAQDNNSGYKLIAHELAHAADYESKRQVFGDLFFRDAKEVIPCPKKRFLWGLCYFIWDEYYASRVSCSFFQEDVETFEDKLFSTSYSAFKTRLQSSRKKYHYHKITLEDFVHQLEEGLRKVLLSAGYLMGLSDAIQQPLPATAPLSVAYIEEPEGQAIMLFHKVLLELWDNQGQWNSFNEFLKLNEPMDRLLNILDIYISTNSDNIHISLPSSSKHL